MELSKNYWRRPWCNGYRHRRWTRRHEFKSWTRLIAFHIALIPLGKVWIQLCRPHKIIQLQILQETPLFFILKILKCIALIDILLTCVIFAGLWLHFRSSGCSIVISVARRYLACLNFPKWILLLSCKNSFRTYYQKFPLATSMTNIRN